MSKSLVFIPTAFHFERFKTLSLNWDQIDVFTYDVNVASLAKDVCNVIDLTSFMSEAEINLNIEKTMEILAFWESEMQGKFVHRGISLAELLVFDQYNFISSFLSMELSLPRLLDAQQPKQIMLFQEFFKPDFCGLPNTYYPDGLNGIVAKHASQRGIELTLIPGLDFTDHQSAFILNLIRENGSGFGTEPVVIDAKKLPQLDLFQGQAFTRCVFLVGYSMEMYDQGLLFNFLKEDPKTLFVFVCLQNTPMIQRGPSFLSLDFRLIKLWPFDLGPVYQKIEAQRKLFFEGKSNLHQRYPEIFQNRFLDFQFHFFFDSLKDGVRSIEAMNLLKQSFQPDLVLAGGSSALGGVRVAVETLNQMKIPTLGFMHGTTWIAHHLRRIPFPFQHFAVRGEKHIGKIQKHVPKSLPATCIGDLREHLQNSTQAPELTQYLNHHFPPSDTRPAILFVTATFMLGFGEIVSNPTKHIQTWEYLTHLANKRKDLRFFLKPHPGYDSFQFYQQICHPHSQVSLLERTLPVTQFIEKVDAVVCVNMYSSTMLETALLGKPFLYLRDACYKSSPLHFEEVAEIPDLLVEDVKDLEAVLDKILQDHNFKQRLLEYGQALMRGFTSYTGETALQKTLALLEHMIASHPVVHGERESNFGYFLVLLAERYLHVLQTGNQSALNEVIQFLQGQLVTESERNAFQTYLNSLSHSLTH
jgi:hypothetical protein